MRHPGFIGGSYLSRSKNWAMDRLFNMYPEINEARAGKDGESGVLIGRPGLRSLATLGSGPVRGVYTASNGRLFAVSGNTFYEIDQFWTATNRGTLNTSTGRVEMDDNGIHMMLVDGADGWTFTFSTDTFAQITDADFPGAGTTRFLDGFFVFSEPGSGRFWTTASYDATDIDALDFATAEARPDDLLTLESDHRTLFLFGKNTTERFYNSGSGTNPFIKYQQGGLIEIGCAAAGSVQKLRSGVLWIGRDRNGVGSVWQVNQNGFPERVSTHAIDLALREAGDLSSVRAWSYQMDGHHFYEFSLGTTFGYDTATGLWHENSYLNDQGEHERWRPDSHAFAFDTHVAGDYTNGELYALDTETFTDNGQEIARERVTPHTSQDNSRIFLPAVELLVEAGVGLDGGASPGSDPKAMLSISRDGGHTFGPERWRSVGELGEYGRRAIWNRNGSGRDIVFKLRMTDPVKTVWLGLDLRRISATAA